MADLNDYSKPDNASNYDTEVLPTLKGSINRAASLDWGSAVNVPVGAKRLTEPSAGDIVVERKTSGGVVTIFDSRDKLNKVGDQALIGQLDIKGVDSTTRHKRLRFLRYDGTVMATLGQYNAGIDSSFFDFVVADAAFRLSVAGVEMFTVGFGSAGTVRIAEYGSNVVAVGGGTANANFRLNVWDGFKVEMSPSGGGAAELSCRAASNAGGLFAMCGAVGKHRINANTGTEFVELLDIGNSGGVHGAGTFYTTNWFGFKGNAAGAALRLCKNGSTGRSINAEGTINASGADYAEYHQKAPGCGAVAKGDIVGIDAHSRVTQRFADAVRYAIKSTDPAYVGGDAWGRGDALGVQEPTAPELDLPGYDGPPDPGPNEPTGDKAAIAAWRKARRLYARAFDQYERSQAAAQQAFDAGPMAQYRADLAAFRAAHEAARANVDRIAYSGQVPVNVYGAAPGDYIVVAAGREGEVEGFPVPASKISFDSYRNAVLRVTEVLEDGRAFGAVIVH